MKELEIIVGETRTEKGHVAYLATVKDSLTFHTASGSEPWNTGEYLKSVLEDEGYKVNAIYYIS